MAPLSAERRIGGLFSFFTNYRKLSFKEAKELKELDVKLPLLEKQKISLEKQITDGNEDISKLSLQLAELIESIQLYEDRWIELSELSESAK